jgi:hypothetical protein
MRPLRRLRRAPKRPRRRKRNLRLPPALLRARDLAADGLWETWQRLQPFLRRIALFARRAAGTALEFLLAILRSPLYLARVGAEAIHAAARWTRRRIDALDNFLRPERVLTVVVLGAIAALVASQFADYRGVRVGNPFYSGVGEVAPAPLRDTQTTVWAHSLALLGVAGAAFAALAAAVIGGRWQLGRVIALLGAVAVVLTLTVDRQRGLDAGTLLRDYTGAEATLLDGFYAQLAAASVLAVSGLLLSQHLKRAVSVHRRRVPRRAGKAGAQPAGAGLEAT